MEDVPAASREVGGQMTTTFDVGDEVRIVGGDLVPGWMVGQVGEVRERNGGVYRVLVRNGAGFPWYVQLFDGELERL